MENLKFFDYIILAGLAILAFIPDPTDALDFGLPLLEPLTAVAYWYIRTRMEKEAK